MSNPFTQTVSPAAITEAQSRYLASLMMQKAELLGLDLAESRAKLDRWLPGLSRDRASLHIAIQAALVGDLKKAAPVVQPDPALPDVPAGRYAVATEAGAINTLAFYKVDRPVEGRWAGRVFVQHIVGGDEERLSPATSRAILAKIAEAGPEAASAAYGREIGQCGVCARPLTNDISRARGIGPVCAEKKGW